MFKSFLKENGGGIAPMFALCLVPVIGCVGLYVDYGRTSGQKAFLQTQADADALGKRNGKWMGNGNYRVEKTEVIKTSFMSVVGIHEIKIDVYAEAVFGKSKEIYEPPVLIEMDNEAADYNELSFYCLDSNTGISSKQVVVADNAGTKFNNKVEPCEGNEVRYQSIRNVRDVRVIPSKWHDPNQKIWLHYSDNLHGPILETVLCDTLAQCKLRSQGGIIPEGRYRDPHVETRECSPGKYMYFGWEDRIGFDYDFNDIRVIIKCASRKIDNVQAAWLAR